jgi:hypothetical protein
MHAAAPGTALHADGLRCWNKHIRNCYKLMHQGCHWKPHLLSPRALILRVYNVHAPGCYFRCAPVVSLCCHACVRKAYELPKAVHTQVALPATALPASSSNSKGTARQATASHLTEPSPIWPSMWS